MNEKQLIGKILKGDTSAFGYFVDTYQDMAVTIAFRICRNRQDAEDVVQEAFVKAFHNLHAFKNSSKFSTWFYRIVYNTALTLVRSSQYNTELVDYQQIDINDSFSDMDTAAQINENERIRLLGMAMRKLPPDESAILTLFYMEDHPIKEIVKITGLSESNVKVKLHRGRKRLSEILVPVMG